MTVHGYEIVVFRDEGQRLTLGDLALHASVHPALIEQLLEFGLITATPKGTRAKRAPRGRRVPRLGWRHSLCPLRS